MRTAFSTLLIGASLLITSCATAPVDTRVADAAAVKTTDEQWASAATRGDLTAILAFYTDDAVILAPNSPIAKDAKSIREIWAPMVVPGTKLSWRATSVEVAKSGDLAYVYGTYDLTMKDAKSGAPIEDKGKFVEIWRKQPDGKWKCAVDTFNSDMPLAPAPPADKKAEKK